MEDNPLQRLAGLAGVEPRFWDVFGNYYETTPEGTRAILAGMGFDVASPQAIERSYTELATRPWRRTLPPVQVFREGREAPYFTMAIPTRLAQRRFRWHLNCDNGVVFEDEFTPAAARLVDARTIDGEEVGRYRIPLPSHFAPGYHRLVLEGAGSTAEMPLIAAPARCYLPAWYERGERLYGLGSHLYALRSASNWGIGDFGTLTRFIDAAVSVGADFAGIDPLHSRLLREPCVPSPYSPSSRRFFNPLYIDVTAVPEFGDLADMREALATAKKLRNAPYVDYEGVAELKLKALAELHDVFAAQHPAGVAGSLRRDAFDAFCAERGDSLRHYSIYQALKNRFHSAVWQRWPEGYRSPQGSEVAAFAAGNARELEYHSYLQWLLDCQLAEVASHAETRGMAVGLYGDLAVGVEPTGAEAWAQQDTLVSAMRFGAPPDTFSPLGQNWGNPPSHPLNLQDRAYQPFAAMLRDNMRHCGALRIDHVMSLMRLYWIPDGASPKDGAYVRYPMDDLLGVLALESHRNRCLVIGEDLGTVPDGFRERMAEEAVLSYRVFYFERYPDGLFKRPDRYPENAVSIATTHDLPTVAGHWRGRDLATRRNLHLAESAAAMDAADKARAVDRELLVAALKDQNLLEPGFPACLEGTGENEVTALTMAVERFLARSPSRLMMVNLDDVFCEPDQLNLPGTTDAYPNWRRKVSRSVETLGQHEFLRAVCSAVADERQGEAPQAED